MHYNPYDYSDRYLTFIALEEGKFCFQRYRTNYGGGSIMAENSIEYSLDNGETWTTLQPDVESPTIPQGGRALLKGNCRPLQSNSYGIGIFQASNNYEMEGNVASLLYGDDFVGQTQIPFDNDFQLAALFAQNSQNPYIDEEFHRTLISVRNMVLPFQNLSEGAYEIMFEGQYNLQYPMKELPAKTLSSAMPYYSMFDYCSSLKEIPFIGANVINEGVGACHQMFRGCTSLKEAVLPCPTIGYDAYTYTFQGCNALRKVTLLADSVIGNKELEPTDWLTTYPQQSGTLYKKASITIKNGTSYVPNGWTVKELN